MKAKSFYQPVVLASVLLILFMSLSTSQPLTGREKQVRAEQEQEEIEEIAKEDLPKTEAEWRRKLTRQQYRILREHETEKAYTGLYWRLKLPGTYHCAGCGQALFSSDHKFKSGTGWPSYYQPADEGSVALRPEFTFFFGQRTEVSCSRCGGHLGHVFADGPPPTGMRYCINGAALKFQEREESSDSPQPQE